MGRKLRRQFEDERWYKIEAARELLYGEEVIDKLKLATTFQELENIMIEARHNI